MMGFCNGVQLPWGSCKGVLLQWGSATRFCSRVLQWDSAMGSVMGFCIGDVTDTMGFCNEVL